MPDLAVVNAAHAQRLQELDPLLPATAVPDHGAGTTVIAAEVDGSVAMGVASRRIENPAGGEALWGPMRSWRLTVRLAGERRAEALDGVLRRWHELRLRTADPGDDDAAAIVTWPSHDVVGPAVLARHGFAPLASIAVRRAGPRRGTPAASVASVAPSVTIRAATDDDVDTMAAMAAELHRYDANFGAAMTRPDSEAVLRGMVAADGDEASRWAWIAEDAGEPVGFVHLQQPKVAAWTGSYVAASPVSYLGFMFVRPQARRSGVGGALVSTAHHTVEEAGIPVTLLHHAVANPTSAPFWARCGYRPLWTEWRRRPAV